MCLPVCIDCFRLAVPSVCVCVCIHCTLYNCFNLNERRLRGFSLSLLPAAAASATATDTGAGEGEPAARLAALSSTYGLICCFVYYFINIYFVFACV